MWQQEYSIETSASPETIWAIFRDVPGWPKWIGGLDHIEMSGSFETGNVLNMTPSGQGPVSAKLFEVRENEGFIDETRLGDVVIRVDHRIQRIASDRTRIVYAIQVTGPSAEDIGRAISADFPEVLKALAAVAESKNRMTRPKFDLSEFEVVGEYPKATSFAIPGIPDMPPEPKLNKPITPKENFKLLLSGKKPYWIPRGGFFFSEVQNFRPRLHPDNIVTHLIFDGEAPYKYTSNKMVSSFFDLEWEYVETAGGATVHPGNPKVPDINKWEEYVSIPDLEELDWEGSSKINKEYCNTDKFVQVAMLSGFWERLISLMGVDHAAVSLIDEDQKEGVKRLFDKLADLFIGQIRRYNKYFNIDCVLMHDDWGHQHSTFFSIGTCREMIVPYFRRVTDVLHELGLSFEFHSCGKNQTLVPAMLEAGIDMWCPQTMNDFDMLTKTYKDSKIVFGLPDPVIPVGLTEAETRQLAKEWVEKYKDCRVMTNFFMPNPIFQNAVYEYSRKAYENEA